MMSAAPHHRSSRSNNLWLSAGIALGIHLAFLGTLIALIELDVVGGAGFSVVSTAEAAGTKAPEEQEQKELEETCLANARLAAFARGAMCLAPFTPAGQLPKCLEDSEIRMFMELSSCRAQRGVIADIAQLQVVEPKAAEKLPQIEAEQLIEELKQLDKPPPPLPQPQPQPQPQQQPPPPPPPPPQQPKTRPQQVVETVKPNTEQAPDNARFLSEHNIKVDNQKVNRGARNEPMVAKAKPEELTAKKDPSKEENAIAKPPPEMAPGKNEKAPENPGKLSMRKPGVQTPSQQQQDAKTKGVLDPDRPLAMDGYRPRPGQGEVSQEKKERGELPTPGENGAGGGTPPMPNLKTSKDQLERALGGGSVDHL